MEQQQTETSPAGGLSELTEGLEPPVPGMKVVPAFAYDPLMMGAWVSCMSWAIGKPEIRDEFKAETGHDIDSIVMARGIDRMIDEETGHAREVFAAWSDWATIRFWGTDEDEGSNVPS